MATATLSTTPTLLDPGSSESVWIVNTGTTTATVLTGTTKARLRPGADRVVHVSGPVTALVYAEDGGTGALSYGVQGARRIDDSEASAVLAARTLLPDLAPSTAATGTLAVGQLARLDCSLASLARTLPSAAAAGAGAVVAVRRTDTSTAFTLSVSPAGADTINASASARVVAMPEVALTFVSDGVSNWSVVSTDTPASRLNGTYAAPQGAWSAGTYGINSVVTYNGSTYRSKVDANTATPGTDATKWETWGGGVNKVARLARRGLPGFAGLPALATAQPTITLSAAGAATSITNSVLMTPEIPGCMRVLGSVLRKTGSAAWDSAAYTYTSSPPWAFEFELDTVDPTGRFEIVMRGNNAGWRVLLWQNNRWEYLTRSNTFTLPGDGFGYRGLITLGAPGVYRVRVEMPSAGQIFGVAIAPTDTMRATAPKPARVIVAGDSFTEPTIVDNFPYSVSGATIAASTDTVTSTAHGLVNRTPITFSVLTGGTGLSINTTYYVINATANTFQLATTSTGSAIDITVDYSAATYSQIYSYWDGWCGCLAHLTGWDVWCSGSGGTGYLNPGSHVKARDRIAEICGTIGSTTNPPDAIAWALGLNDGSFGGITYAALYAEALLCYQTAASLVPGVTQIVLPPWIPRDITSITSNQLMCLDAIQAAAAAAGVLYVPIIPQPLAQGSIGYGLVGTLASGAAIAATSVSSTVSVPVGGYIRIGNVGDANGEIRKVTGNTGSGPYTLQFNGTGGGGALLNTHASGEAVTAVGPGIYTGTGKQTALTGSGNADRYTGSDGTHPTVAGHLNIAVQTVRGLLEALV